MPRRPTADRHAERQIVTGLAVDLRAARADLRAAIKALPAPAARNPAQRRDALILRTLALIVQALLATWGQTTTADRDPTEA